MLVALASAVRDGPRKEGDVSRNELKAVPTVPGGRRALLAEAWPPILVVAVLYGLIAYFLLQAFDFNPTGPIHIGSFMPADRFWNASTRFDPNGIGYDGQWYFYIAHDPLLRAPDPEAFLDLPAYRCARILYPSLAWIGALGQPGALPWSMLGVNLLAVLVGTIGAVDLLRALGGDRWLSLVLALSPAMLLGTLAALTEPTATALIVVGLALAFRGRHTLAGCCLAFAVLAREPALLVPLGTGLYAAGRCDWRRAGQYLVPLLLPIGWHLLIWARLGILPSAQNGNNFDLPFGGPIHRLALLWGWGHETLAAPMPTQTALAETAIVLASAAIMVLGLTRIFQRRDVLAWLFFLHAALALCTSPAIWTDLYSYGRTLGMLYVCFGMVVLTGPERRSPYWERLDEWARDVPDWTIFKSRVDVAVTLCLGRALSTLKRQEHRT